MYCPYSTVHGLRTSPECILYIYPNFVEQFWTNSALIK